MVKSNKGMKKDSFLAQLAKTLLSQSRKSYINELFIRAGYKKTEYSIISISFLFSIAVSFFIYFLIILNPGIVGGSIVFSIFLFFILFPIIEIFMVLLFYNILKTFLKVKGYNRVQNIVLNLPLFLREFSTNLKAGRDFVDSLEDAISDELGYLSDDIEEIVIGIKSGNTIENVLKKYTERYESYEINESFQIILEAYKGGGGLYEITDKIAENLETIHYLKKNSIASVLNYVIFTTIVALIIAPLLFALSYNLLELIGRLLERVAITSSANVPINIPELNIDLGKFRVFSQMAVGIVAGSAAPIIVTIEKGSLKRSPTKILIYIGLSLLMYWVSFYVLDIVFNMMYKTLL